MRKIFISLVLAGLNLAAIAQSDDKTNKVEFYGFVRVDAYMDSYKGQDLGHDMFYLVPQYSKLGDVEINKQPSANISAIASRLGVKINGPQAFEAKLTGLLEFDFAGNLRSDPTLFRIRQAYTQLTWEKSSLLIGQTWHPFFGGANMPTVAGLNTGAPFNAFNRSPMVRYNFNMPNFVLSMAAVTEIQYSSPSADYPVYMNTNNHAKRNGIIPELVLTGDYSLNNKLFIGAGAEYKRIKPRMVTQNDAGTYFKADSYLATVGFVGYIRYKTEKLSVLAKGYFGENMSHLVMPGGYGIASHDAANGKETYTPYKHYTAYINAVYGKAFQVGIFAAYGKNLGTNSPLYDAGNGAAKTYGLFLNVQDMMRFAPHIAYNHGKLRFVAEIETTIATYGQGPINLQNGLYDSSPTATNNRLIATVTHYF